MTCRYCEAPPRQCNHCDRCGEPKPTCVCQFLTHPVGTDLTKPEESQLVTITVPLRVAKRAANAVRFALETEEFCDDQECLCCAGDGCHCEPDYYLKQGCDCDKRIKERREDMTYFLRSLFNRASETLQRDWGFFSPCMDGEHRQALQERFGSK